MNGTLGLFKCVSSSDHSHQLHTSMYICTNIYTYIIDNTDIFMSMNGEA